MLFLLPAIGDSPAGGLKRCARSILKGRKKLILTIHIELTAVDMLDEKVQIFGSLLKSLELIHGAGSRPHDLYFLHQWAQKARVDIRKKTRKYR